MKACPKTAVLVFPSDVPLFYRISRTGLFILQNFTKETRKYRKQHKENQRLHAANTGLVFAVLLVIDHGYFFEIVAKAKVTEHLKKGMVIERMVRWF